jgi:hypothetical protein
VDRDGFRFAAASRDSRPALKPQVRYRIRMSREAWIAVVALGVVVAAVTLYGTVRLLIKVVRTRRLLGELGAAGKFAFYGAIVYTILPVDLIPDPIYLDDMGVLSAALFFLSRQVIKRRAQHGKNGQAVDPRRAKPSTTR